MKPDLVFLDLQMPVMSGFEVVRNLSGKHAPVVVIVTAFDHSGTLHGRAQPHFVDRLKVLALQAERELVWIVTAKERLLSL